MCVCVCARVLAERWVGYTHARTHTHTHTHARTHTHTHTHTHCRHMPNRRYDPSVCLLCNDALSYDWAVNSAVQVLVLVLVLVVITCLCAPCPESVCARLRACLPCSRPALCVCACAHACKLTSARKIGRVGQHGGIGSRSTLMRRRQLSGP